MRVARWSLAKAEQYIVHAPREPAIIRDGRDAGDEVAAIDKDAHLGVRRPVELRRGRAVVETPNNRSRHKEVIARIERARIIPKVEGRARLIRRDAERLLERGAPALMTGVNTILGILRLRRHARPE